MTVAGQEVESYTRTLFFGVWHPKSVSLDMSLISRKISAGVKAVACEIRRGNTLTLPCSGTVWRGCFLHALPEVGGTWMPSPRLLALFSHLWKSPLVLLRVVLVTFPA